MKRLVMVGVGATQLSLLEGLAAGHVKAAEPVLISDTLSYAYDAMQPGWLAGRHDEAAMSIDLQALAERAGCRFIQADIKRIDAATRTIEFTDGRSETWEALSLARSSIRCDARVPGAAEFTVPIRPMARAREIMPAVERAQQVFDKREIRIAVVGATGRGFETACALRARLLRDGTSATIMLVDGEPELLPRCPANTRSLAARVLVRLSIASALGARVVDLSRRGLRLTSGAIMPADVVVWTVGNAPAAGLTHSGMTLDERGFVQFDETLRSVSHPDVFVAGESADMGTALTDNVAAFCGDAPARRYRRYQPSTRQLTLLDCGDGSALLAYGGVAREGRMAMRLKESLDRRFISRYQRLAGAT
jgi:NADH dehydrogenase FAD-containing subunit